MAALPAVVLLATAAVALGACGSSGSPTARTGVSSATTAAGAPPAPPGGAAPGSSTPTHTPTGQYTLDGGTASLNNRTITATASDRSGILVKNSGVLTLVGSAIRTSGNSQSSDESSFYGLNAGILAQSKGKVRMSGGSVLTTGSGANGVFAYGAGASVSVTGATIKDTGQYAHGAMTAGGGRVTLRNVRISTAGASSAAVATDRGGGVVNVNGGTMTTSGGRSPDIYSTGAITVTGATMRATGAEGAVVEGANSIAIANCSLGAGKSWGILLYNSMSGDAATGTGRLTMTGGKLRVATGPAVRVTNTSAVVTLRRHATVTAASGVLLRADAEGTGSGNTNPGRVTFTAQSEALSGDLVAATTSTISATLQQTSLAGKISNAGLRLDRTSKWTVTGNSALTTLVDPAGIAGTTITNVVGAGHTVTYKAALSGNAALGGKTYRLAGGGELKPA